MHRHGYRGRKFSREKDQRQALMKSLADSLVLREQIQTTLPKAKELNSYVEKLITKAKKGELHHRRQIISALATKEAAHKLVDEIAPKLSGRNSGHLRVERVSIRRGDGAQLARIGFVDDLSKAEKPTNKKAEITAKEESTNKNSVAPRRKTVKKDKK